jgi:hypothetical protein
MFFEKETEMTHRINDVRFYLATSAVFVGLMLVAVTGCTRSTETEGVVVTSEYLLQQEPVEAQEVKAAREATDDGAEVVLVGRIGGAADPWVKNRAAFTIVDNSLQACSDMPGDECQTPWDYCCQTDLLPAATALVKVVDADGKLIDTDARQLLGVKELDRVVVHGKAKRDKDGNFTVLADGVFVKQ